MRNKSFAVFFVKGIRRDPATGFEVRHRRRTNPMDYGVPAALGVAPELMEEVSTGVSARPPRVQKDVPSQIRPSFRELPSHDAVRLTPVPSSDEQTTIMACVYDGGVVLGADSRTSTGNYVANRASDKITQVVDNVWMCRSGSVRAPPLPFPTRPTRSPRRCDTSPASRSLVSNPRMTTPRLSPFVADPSY